MNKWSCTVIKDAYGKYYAELIIDGCDVKGLPRHVNYKTLKEAIQQKTGITILKHKDMIWERLSDTEKIATIDATQYRGEGTDCRVIIKERKNGWKPCFD